MRPELEKVQGQLGGRDTAAAEVAVDSQTRIQQAQISARNESTAFGVGLSETERLLDRQARLHEAIADRMRAVNLQGATAQQRAEGIAQALVFQNQLIESGVEADKRRNELERQYKQLLLDRQREYGRTLLSDGPDQLLKRLAVSSLTQRTWGRVSEAQFIGLGAEGRKLLEEIPGYGAEERRLRREAGYSGRAGRDTLRDIYDARELIQTGGSSVGQAGAKGLGLDGVGNTLLDAGRAFHDQVVTAARELAQILRQEISGRSGINTARMTGFQPGH